MRPGRGREAVAAPRTTARFPDLDPRAGHYESFYVKATRPGGGLGAWIRHTVHKRPGAPPTGALWFTLFDAAAEAPRATKLTAGAEAVAAPAGAYVEIAGARLEPGRARGEITGTGLDVAWDLEIASRAEAFPHLPYEVLYRAPLPRTKLLSPHPDARCSGEITVAGERIEVEGWPAMVGHNWGAEHAERWSWIQANDFGAEDAWLDAALGRIAIGGWTTPWVGNAMLSLDGEGHRLGGLDRVRSTRLSERPTGADFRLTGREIAVSGRVGAAAERFVAWVYADPDGPEHNVLNCSICDLELTVERPGRPPRILTCTGAAAYELGLRETDHGIPLQPFGDG